MAGKERFHDALPPLPRRRCLAAPRSARTGLGLESPSYGRGEAGKKQYQGH